LASRLRSGATPLAAGFRLRALRIALALTWLAVILVGVPEIRNGGVEALYGPLTGAALGAIALSFVRWRSVLATRVGDLVISAWMVAALVLVTFAPQLGFGRPSFGAYAVVIVFASLLLPRSAAAVVALLGCAGMLVSDQGAGGTSFVASLLAGGSLLAIAGVAAVAAGELRNRDRQESLQLQQLRRQEGALLQREAELERLYAVARSIGAGRTLPEVIPVLVRRVAESIRARTGMVFVYRPQYQALELLSPLWLKSDAEEIGRDHRLPLIEDGVAQRVYLDGTPAMANRRDEASGAWGELVAELRITSYVAVPLRTTDGEVGVLLVSDKLTGPFSEQDVSAVADLAAPAALVIDHIRRFQEAKETSERMAELAKLKSDFVSVVSHELRTPLTSIMGVLQTVTRPELAPENPDVRHLLEAGVSQADRLKELIEDLLVVSQVDNRAIRVRPEILDIAGVIRAAVAGVAGAELVVTARISPTLPEVIADPNHLTRVLINLLANAVKYADGSEIDIRVAPEGNFMVITVADKGPGLPYELTGKAFEPFTQLRRTEVAGRGGIGLGLAICRGLMEAMGGTISHEPTVGGGATFNIRVPLQPHAVEATDSEPPTLLAS
jgi:signal transduction histidine kinase